MKHHSKFSQHHEHNEEQHSQEQSPAQSAREFSNSDDLLRHDAIHTPVPPEIEERLKASVGNLPEPKRSWLKRLFGGNKP